VAGVEVENFSMLLTFFVTSVVSDNTPQLLDVLATISQLFNLLFNQWITKKIIYQWILFSLKIIIYSIKT